MFRTAKILDITAAINKSSNVDLVTWMDIIANELKLASAQQLLVKILFSHQSNLTDDAIDNIHTFAKIQNISLNDDDDINSHSDDLSCDSVSRLAIKLETIIAEKTDKCLNPSLLYTFDVFCRIGSYLTINSIISLSLTNHTLFKLIHNESYLIQNQFVIKSTH